MKRLKSGLLRFSTEEWHYNHFCNLVCILNCKPFRLSSYEFFYLIEYDLLDDVQNDIVVL